MTIVGNVSDGAIALIDLSSSLPDPYASLGSNGTSSVL
jgi:hypothetical protein